jgi:ABC-type nitrate/sulfonate/bicarbonate transport system substrate-binding protein
MKAKALPDATRPAGRRRLVRAIAVMVSLAGAGTVAASAPLAFAVARLPLSLPIYVAQANGYFEAENLQLRVDDCEIGRACLERLLAGQADLATAADSPIVLASLRGAKFSVIATIATSRRYSKLLTRRGSGIESVADLAGRRVGTFVGTSAQYFLDVTLVAGGVDPARVVLVPLQPQDAAHALATGRVDAVAVFEPFAFAAAKALGQETRLITGSSPHQETWNVVASPGLAGSEADLEAFCRAIERAALFIAREPAKARSILRERLGLDEAAVDWVWPDITYAITLRQSLITGLEAQARWALRYGHATGTPPNYLDYVDSEPLRRVRPGAARIVE